MALTVEVAAQAGDLAAAITARTDKIAQINVAIRDGWTITQIIALSPDNNSLNVLLGTLAADLASKLLQASLGIYQQQVTALTAQLAALDVSAAPVSPPA